MDNKEIDKISDDVVEQVAGGGSNRTPYDPTILCGPKQCPHCKRLINVSGPKSLKEFEDHVANCNEEPWSFLSEK